MATNRRMQIAAGMMLTLAAAPSSASVPAARASAKRYICGTQQEVVIKRNRSRARVEFADGSYDLRRQRSEIGQKYLSPAAALIIDGHSAIFVAEDRLDLGTCSEAAFLTYAH